MSTRLRRQFTMGIAPATTTMGIARGTVTIMGIAPGAVTIAVGSNDDCSASHCLDADFGSEQMCGMPSLAATKSA